MTGNADIQPGAMVPLPNSAMSSQHGARGCAGTDAAHGQRQQSVSPGANIDGWRPRSTAGHSLTLQSEGCNQRLRLGAESAENVNRALAGTPLGLVDRFRSFF